MAHLTFRFDFKAMGSRCEILLCSEDEGKAHAAANAGIAEVHRIEHKYSRYQPNSIVGQINLAAGNGQWLECDAETRWLFDYAATLHAQSDGIFDITSGVLRRAWDFNLGIVPDAETLNALLPLVGWTHVERDAAQVRLALPGMEVDFGGFGKEYAADSAAATLTRHGIAHGYVNLGGDIRVIGPQPDGQPWLIAIQNPRRHDQIVATIPMIEGGLATSGDYEKYFEKDGRRYCHILDPATGWPVSHWQSVSVMAPLAIVAGSYSTIAMLKQARATDFLAQARFDYLAFDQTGKAFHPSPSSGNDGSNQFTH